VAQLAVVEVLVDMDHQVPVEARGAAVVITEVQEGAATVMLVAVVELVPQNNLLKWQQAEVALVFTVRAAQGLAALGL
jgi:hypothetical protein